MRHLKNILTWPHPGKLGRLTLKMALKMVCVWVCEIMYPEECL